MTHDEHRKLNGFRQALAKNKAGIPGFTNENDKTIIEETLRKDETMPNSWNWTEKGYVTPVKDQGQCGSCWAFSATGCLEGQYKNATNKLVNLSEQQLMDCSNDEGNMGCDGGLMDLAFAYVKKNEGLSNQTSYPFVGTEQSECTKHADIVKDHKIHMTIKQIVDIKKDDGAALKSACYRNGPISCAMNAGTDFMFMFYRGGVFQSGDCPSNMLDHGVLLCGFGTQEKEKDKKDSKDIDYWYVKNSWGTGWGEQGYFRIARENNTCGLSSLSSYALISVKK